MHVFEYKINQMHPATTYMSNETIKLFIIK